MPCVRAVLSYVSSGAALWILEFGSIESSFSAFNLVISYTFTWGRGGCNNEPN